ncbi:hypothetical protein LF599_07525 [Pseudodesulfovibrio thermohalotolerans]|uniref:phage minor capsid protein n=1 Tax=Pseudodesulfovibrio thermohalotolerans TaxID=2880651 RepID=UPI0024416743|nr:phage minor capsid protein [Pseudodesulfovibrio thermohalotolerans]WFS64004.1 hypothetical protein LF599_07525 [Pseudodesulfovibrio thermohalotolerans]
MPTSKEAPWQKAVDTGVRLVLSAYEDGSGRLLKVLSKHRKDTGRWAKSRIDRTMKLVNKELATMEERIILGLESGAEIAVGSINGKWLGIPSDIARTKAQTARMAAQIQEQLTLEAREVVRQSTLLDTTKKDSAKQLSDKHVSRGLTTNFADKSGKKWKSDTYFEVLAYAAVGNAARNAQIDKIAEDGSNLVLVAGPAGGCPKCAPWIGLVLSLVGDTDEYQTVDEAMNSGLFHPRCRHYPIPYQPEKEKKKKE